MDEVFWFLCFKLAGFKDYSGRLLWGLELCTKTGKGRMERFEKCRDSIELSNRGAGGDTPEAGKCCMEKFLFIILLRISYGTFFAHKTATLVCRMLFTGKTWKIFCKRWISSVWGEARGRKVADTHLGYGRIRKDPHFPKSLSKLRKTFLEAEVFLQMFWVFLRTHFE